PADVVPAVPTVVGLVLDRDLPPRQRFQLPVQAGLVGFDHADVGGVLHRHQPVRVFALVCMASYGDPVVMPTCGGGIAHGGGDTWLRWSAQSKPSRKAMIASEGW